MTVKCTFQYLVVSCVLIWARAHEAHGSPPRRCLSVLSFSSERPALKNDNGDIHMRSLSPWTWRPTVSEHQIPSTVWEAECSDDYCSESAGPADGPRNNAVPIYLNLLVLSRGQGESCYVASYRRVSVGCTCVRPDIV